MSVRYIGSKARVADAILDLAGQPMEGRFVDAFCGTGAVAAVAAAREWCVTVNDSLPSAVAMSVGATVAKENVRFEALGGYTAAVHAAPDPVVIYEPVYVYDEEYERQRERERQENAELIAKVVVLLVAVATPHAKRLWLERPAQPSRRAKPSERHARLSRQRRRTPSWLKPPSLTRVRNSPLPLRTTART